jgi:hypothetical protein
MALTPPPTAPSTSDPATFDARADAHVAWQATNVTEMTALTGALNSLAAGTASAIPYIFSTTTTDVDPGAGYLRLNNATQNAATVIRADLAGSDGTTFTSLLDTFDDSTSTVKGQIVLMKFADPTKWLAFNVTAVATPSGYRNITVANVASSAASPFADGDEIILKFTRTGDKGDTGASGANGSNGILSGYFQSSDQTITAAGALTIAHGLGTTPLLISGLLKNNSAELGYAVGEVTPALSEPSNSRGVSITADTTNIYIKYGSAANSFPIVNKSNGTAGTITNASWRFLVRAWA